MNEHERSKSKDSRWNSSDEADLPEPPQVVYLPPAPQPQGAPLPDEESPNAFVRPLHDSILAWVLDTGHPVLALEFVLTRFVDGDESTDKLESLLQAVTEAEPVQSFKKHVLDDALLHCVMTETTPPDSLLDFILQTMKLPGAVPSQDLVADIEEQQGS